VRGGAADIMTDAADQPRPGDVQHENYAYTLDPDISDNARFVELKAYWDGKRGTRAMPERRDVDPLELRGHLGSLVLIDVLPGLIDFRMRLIGTNITRVYGRDSTGKAVSELKAADPEWWRFCDELYRAVAALRKIARARGTLQMVGKEFRHFDALLLPLDAGDGSVGMILAEQHFA
jgi:hypothetical protein